MTITVYINDKPTTWDKCHSSIDVDGYENAVALLWWMAKQATPEYACFFKGENHINTPMLTADMPDKFKPLLVQWDVWFEHCDPANQNPCEGMEAIIVEALNTKYDSLMSELGDIDPQAFIKELTHYANRWARDCYQETPHLYQDLA